VYFPEHQYPEHLCENSKIYILGFKKTLVIVGVKKERKASPKSSTRYSHVRGSGSMKSNNVAE